MKVKLNTFIGEKYGLVGEIIERDSVKVPFLTADIPAIEWVRVKWDNPEHGESKWIKESDLVEVTAAEAGAESGVDSE